MWTAQGHSLEMVEGDWGILLPINISGVTFATNDEIKLLLKNKQNGDTILEKTYGNITDNTINLELTEDESALLQVGAYVYSLDWYQDGAFLCNIIPLASFKVVDKA